MASGTARAVALLAALAVAVGGCSLEPRAAVPSSAASIELVASDTGGRFPVAVRVVDQSGRLREARAVTPVELTAELARSPMEGAALGAWPFAGSDRRVAIVWNGSACDRNASIVIASGVETVTVAAGTPEACSGQGTYRAVVLVFDGPIVVDEIDLALD